jgi:PTH1 family peptidyl-tRNA hydrolase
LSKAQSFPQLFCALGNPGAQYQNNRHNVGWLFFKFWSLTSSEKFTDKFKGQFAKNNQGQIFLRPQTYMNVSGESLIPCAQFFKVPMAHVCVIHDELDIPLGQFELKYGGGLAGHNGLKSIAALSGTQDFFRLRIGIGRPLFGSVSDWVLGDFSREEHEVNFKTFPVIEMLSQWSEGEALSKLQSLFNKKFF